MNVSRQRQQELLLKLEAVRNRLSGALPQGESRELLGFLDEVERELKAERYGLVFERHGEQVRETLRHSRPVLREEKNLFLDNGGGRHTLIEGDNLAALRILQGTHAGGIDLIYIDPPYNTGKTDISYNDRYTDRSDEFRHSRWLSFMESRLSLSRPLLAQDGLILISIDDRELFALKLLCDRIFGEQNFVSCVSCHANPGGKKSGLIENTIQYLLVFARNRAKALPLGTRVRACGKEFPCQDEAGRYRRGSQLEKWGRHDTIRTHPRLAYSLYYNPADGSVTHLFDYNVEELEKDRSADVAYLEPDMDLTSRGYVCIRPRVTNSGEHGRWRLEPDTFYRRLREDGFIFRKTRRGYKIYEKERERPTRFVRAKNFIPAEIARQESRELKGILGGRLFDYAKPLAFMRHIIGLYQKKNAVVLDFFAGSGTTGQAVLELNAQDGGSRTFILCTSNENGICRDVAYERLRIAMTGVRRDGSVYSGGLAGSLGYFRVEYLPPDTPGGAEMPEARAREEPDA